MAAIVQLKTRPERLRQDQAEELRQALLPFEDQMPDAVRALIGHIDRQTASREKWTFVMLSPEQNGAVVNYLAEHSKRPLVAMRLWALCFEHLRQDTGEIMLTRQEIAEKLGQKPPEVSAIMSELANFGAIIRSRNVNVQAGPGVGMTRYFMNPRVATHLAGRERDDAQADAPLLKLMEGGKVG
jgi:CRP-like cAMP-binding protein